MSASAQVLFVVLLLLRSMLSSRCPVLDRAPINSSTFVEKRCMPYVLSVKEADSTSYYFVNETSCNLLFQFQNDVLYFFPNFTNLSDMVFVSLAAPQLPLVLLEAGCVSAAPFDCLDQVNVPVTITGVVPFRHQNNPVMLVRKTDYQSLHQEMKNTTVVVWCGTETTSYLSPSLLSRKKTRSRTVIKKYQPSELNKLTTDHRKNIFTSGTVLVIILVAVALLFVILYLTFLCIKQAQRQLQNVCAQRDNEILRVQTGCHELTQRRGDTLVSSEMVPQSSKKFCHSFTQTDHNSKQSDLLEEYGSRAGGTGTKETTDNMEQDGNVAGKES